MATVKCDQVECEFNEYGKCNAESVELVTYGSCDELYCCTRKYNRKLNHCPNCGYWDVKLYHVNEPLAYWDGDTRGQNKWTVCCNGCGLNISDDYADKVVEIWNGIGTEGNLKYK